MILRSFLPLTLCYFLLACAEPPTNTSADHTASTEEQEMGHLILDFAENVLNEKLKVEYHEREESSYLDVQMIFETDELIGYTSYRDGQTEDKSRERNYEGYILLVAEYKSPEGAQYAFDEIVNNSQTRIMELAGFSGLLVEQVQVFERIRYAGGLITVKEQYLLYLLETCQPAPLGDSWEGYEQIFLEAITQPGEQLTTINADCYMDAFIVQDWANPEKPETQTLENQSERNHLSDQIWSVFQDSKGNYWFGSNGEGIYVYDVISLRHYTTTNGLVNNTIRGFQEDAAGNIYVETPQGVSKFDGILFSTLPVNKSAPNDWKLEPGDLWFACNGDADHVYRCDGEQLYQLKLPKQDLASALGIYEGTLRYSPYTVFGIDKDKDGNLWLGTGSAGAYRYDGESFLWIGEKELSTLPDGRVPGVRSMLQDQDGNMWLSNFLSKYRINESLENGYEKLKAVDANDPVLGDKLPYFNSGLVAQNGDLWMTTYGGGVWTYDGETLTNAQVWNATGEVLLLSIFEDRDGVIWLGTHNDGVYRQTETGFEKFVPEH